MFSCLPFSRNNEGPRASPNPLNVLLTNGRFPITLDLARQLHAAGHYVFVIDPMQYHICKFSTAVKRSYYSPAPNVDAQGYIKAVKMAIQKSKIDLIIPLHEEIFYLAENGDKHVLSRLLAPSIDVLYCLHNKWSFTRLVRGLGLDVPETHFCNNINDIHALDRTKEWAVKPILGRASMGVHHLRPNDRHLSLETIDISENKPYIAQQWVTGERYCAYGVFKQGKMEALGIYPVLETIDGSSSVYFESANHEGIRAYVRRIAEALQVTGQLAFDFIENGEKSISSRQDLHTSTGRLVAIECNPRATSGIHLWSGTPYLANVLTSSMASLPSPSRPIMRWESQSDAPKELRAKPGFKRQVGPAMLMWEHKNASFRRYIEHMKRLLQTRDVVFSWSDIWPVLMQPFLLTSYYEICRERGNVSLPDM